MQAHFCLFFGRLRLREAAQAAAGRAGYVDRWSFRKEPPILTRDELAERYLAQLPHAPYPGQERLLLHRIGGVGQLRQVTLGQLVARENGRLLPKGPPINIASAPRGGLRGLAKPQAAEEKTKMRLHFRGGCTSVLSWCDT